MRLNRSTSLWFVINVVLSIMPFWIWDAHSAWWLAFFWSTMFACLAIVSWTVWALLVFLQTVD